MGYIGNSPALNESVTSAQIADNAITLAKMASGTDGAMITYDTDGNPVAITGTDGQVATSAGADAVSAFEAAGGDVSKVGTPANNEVGIWTGDGTIEGESNITYDGTTFTVSDAFALGTGSQFREIGVYNANVANDTFEAFHTVGATEDGNWLMFLFSDDQNLSAIVYMSSSDGGGSRVCNVLDQQGNVDAGSMINNYLGFKHATGTTTLVTGVIYKVND